MPNLPTSLDRAGWANADRAGHSVRQRRRIHGNAGATVGRGGRSAWFARGEWSAVTRTSSNRLRMPERSTSSGRTLLPGLIDAHNHFLATGESLAAISLQQLRPTSKQQLLDIIPQAALNTSTGDEITLSGFDPAKLGEGSPTRWELDEVAPQHRVVAYHVSGHGVLVNSRGAGRRPDSMTSPPDPDGGSYSRDEQGRLNGLCMDCGNAARHPERSRYRCAWTELPRERVRRATYVRGRTELNARSSRQA